MFYILTKELKQLNQLIHDCLNECPWGIRAIIFEALITIDCHKEKKPCQPMFLRCEHLSPDAKSKTK